MATRFFLYARKSTDSEERQILSIEAQLTELRLHAEKERLAVVEEFTEAMTAKEPGRPIFNRMLEKIEKGEADGILAWHPDRLARNSVDGGRVVYFIDKGLITALKFPTFWFENTPQGKFMLNIAFGQSKYYIDNLSENVRRGQRQKLRRGEWPGPAPLGYLNDKTTNTIIVDPVRGPLVRKLFETLADDAWNLHTMKRLAASWGLTNRGGAVLSRSMIERPLKNPFYFGLMRYHGELHEGKHPPLISKELFDRVQDVLRHKERPAKFRKHPYHYTKFIVCKQCGCFITAERQKGHVYYRCTRKKGHCDEPYVREEKLDAQVSASIARVALPPEVSEGLLAELGREERDSRQTLQQEKERVATPLQEITQKLDRLLDAHLAGVISQNEYVKKKEALLHHKATLEEKLKTIETKGCVWLEPCRNFLKTASDLNRLAASQDFAAKLCDRISLSSSVVARRQNAKIWTTYTIAERVGFEPTLP